MLQSLVSLIQAQPTNHASYKAQIASLDSAQLILAMQQLDPAAHSLALTYILHAIQLPWEAAVVELACRLLSSCSPEQVQSIPDQCEKMKHSHASPMSAYDTDLPCSHSRVQEAEGAARHRGGNRSAA